MPRDDDELVPLLDDDDVSSAPRDDGIVGGFGNVYLDPKTPDDDRPPPEPRPFDAQPAERVGFGDDGGEYDILDEEPPEPRRRTVVAATPDKPQGPDGQPVYGEIACSACGYNLLGLPVGRRCPECGTMPVASTSGAVSLLSFVPLANADPRWLGLVAVGALTVVCAVVVTILGNIAFMAVGVPFILRMMFDVIMTFGITCGLWLLTLRDPVLAQGPRTDTPDAPVLRWIVRGIAALMFLLSVGQAVAFLASNDGTANPAPVVNPGVQTLLNIASSVALLVLPLSTWYVVTLASRTPIVDLEGEARTLTVYFFVVIGLLLGGIAAAIGLGIVGGLLPALYVLIVFMLMFYLVLRYLRMMADVYATVWDARLTHAHRESPEEVRTREVAILESRRSKKARRIAR